MTKQIYSCFTLIYYLWCHSSRASAKAHGSYTSTLSLNSSFDLTKYFLVHVFNSTHKHDYTNKTKKNQNIKRISNHFKRWILTPAIKRQRGFRNGRSWSVPPARCCCCQQKLRRSKLPGAEEAFALRVHHKPLPGTVDRLVSWKLSFKCPFKK